MVGVDRLSPAMRIDRRRTILALQVLKVMQILSLQPSHMLHYDYDAKSGLGGQSSFCSTHHGSKEQTCQRAWFCGSWFVIFLPKPRRAGVEVNVFHYSSAASACEKTLWLERVKQFSEFFSLE